MGTVNYDEVFKEWKAYGDDVCEVRNQLIKIICNPEYQELLSNKKINDILSKALDDIDKFRSKAEDRMFEKINPPDEPRWLDVFYGERNK